MGNTLREGIRVVRERSVLVAILSIGIFFGMHTEGLDRLWEAYLLKNFTFPEIGTLEPVIWFGVINVGANIIQIVGTEITRRSLDTSSQLAVPRALYFLLIRYCWLRALLLSAWLVTLPLLSPFIGPFDYFVHWIEPLIRFGLISTLIPEFVLQFFSMMGQAGRLWSGGGWSHFRSGWSYRISPCSHGRRWSTLIPGVCQFFVRTIRRYRVSCSITRNLLGGT